jgi:hypothetical protein
MTALVEDFRRAAHPPDLAEAAGVTLYPWQFDLLADLGERTAVVSPRQGGKTLVAGLSALHTGLFRPGSVSLVLSASERQAREAFRYALTFYRRVGRPVEAEAENRLSLELENGSRLHVIPASASTVRGFAADLLVIDEAAYIDDSLFEATLPMLAATKGKVLMMSTPNGRRGYFAEVFLSDDPRWKKVRVTVEDCPGISSEVVEEFERRFGRDATRQEFYGEFLAPDRGAFSSDDIDRALAAKVEPWTL